MANCINCNTELRIDDVFQLASGYCSDACLMADTASPTGPLCFICGSPMYTDIAVELGVCSSECADEQNKRIKEENERSEKALAEWNALNFGWSKDEW